MSIFSLKYLSIDLVSRLSLVIIYPDMVVLMTAKQRSSEEPNNLASSMSSLFLAISSLVSMSM